MSSIYPSITLEGPDEVGGGPIEIILSIRLSICVSVHHDFVSAQ